MTTCSTCGHRCPRCYGAAVDIIVANRVVELEKRLDEASAKDPAFAAWLNESIEFHPNVERDRASERASQVEGIRRSLRLTQAQAAASMGVARTTVVAIEQGKRGVALEELDRLRGAP